jgi:phosphatidylglycerophosphate synthase
LFGISSFNIGLVLLFVATVLTLWSGFNYLTAGLKTFDS